MNKTHRPRTISRRETILLPLGAGLVTAVGASSIAGTALAAVAQTPGQAAVGGGAASGVTQDMQALVADRFADLVGETFTVGNHAVVLRDVRRGPKSGSGFREQFAVVFDAPPTAAAPLTPLPVSHSAIGRHDLLVTSIGGGTALEICFS